MGFSVKVRPNLAPNNLKSLLLVLQRPYNWLAGLVLVKIDLRGEPNDSEGLSVDVPLERALALLRACLLRWPLRTRLRRLLRRGHEETYRAQLQPCKRCGL